jgi:hypothetical protein
LFGEDRENNFDKYRGTVWYYLKFVRSEQHISTNSSVGITNPVRNPWTSPTNSQTYVKAQGFACEQNYMYVNVSEQATASE